MSSPACGRSPTPRPRLLWPAIMTNSGTSDARPRRRRRCAWPSATCTSTRARPVPRPSARPLPGEESPAALGGPGPLRHRPVTSRALPVRPNLLARGSLLWTGSPAGNATGSSPRLPTPGKRVTCPYCKGTVLLGPATAPPASPPAAPQSASVQPASAVSLARAAPGSPEGPDPSARGSELSAGSFGTCPQPSAAPPARPATGAAAAPGGVPSATFNPPAGGPDIPHHLGCEAPSRAVPVAASSARSHGPHFRRRPLRGWTGSACPAFERVAAPARPAVGRWWRSSGRPRPGGGNSPGSRPRRARPSGPAVPVPSRGHAARRRGQIATPARARPAKGHCPRRRPGPTGRGAQAPTPSGFPDQDAPILLVQAHSLDRLSKDLEILVNEIGLTEQIKA